LAFPFALIELTPAEFWFPLLLVTTPVFDETVLLFVFAGTFALVSTTPSRRRFPALLFLFACTKAWEDAGKGAGSAIQVIYFLSLVKSSAL